MRRPSLSLCPSTPSFARSKAYAPVWKLPPPKSVQPRRAISVVLHPPPKLCRASASRNIVVEPPPPSALPMRPPSTVCFSSSLLRPKDNQLGPKLRSTATLVSRYGEPVALVLTSCQTLPLSPESVTPV